MKKKTRKPREPRQMVVDDGVTYFVRGERKWKWTQARQQAFERMRNAKTAKKQNVA